MFDFIYKIDYFFAELFHKFYLWGGKFANILMDGISLLGEMGILFLTIGFALALFKRTRKIGATILFSVAIGFLLTNVLLKNIIERARPFENKTSNFFMWWLDAGATNEDGFSFPSGHTTATTAFAMAIFFSTNKEKSWPILFLPILMASSRIYLMVHYFSDCVGGIIVGTISALIAVLIVKLIYKSKLKFFIWARDVDLFKSKKTETSNSKQIEEQSKVEDFVYTTQDNEVNIYNKENASNKDNNSLSS